MDRGSESLLGGSGGPAGNRDDEGSEEVDLTSVLWPDPVSAWAAEAPPPEVTAGAEAMPFPCWLGETWQSFKEEVL